MTFTYPMVGGTMGVSPSHLSFGIYNNYCSFAPEFNTYDIIRTLGIDKTSLPWYCSTTTGLGKPISEEGDNIDLLIYPNPFSAETKIKYSVSEKTKVIIKISDYLGIIVSVRNEGEKTKGTYDFIFDGFSLHKGVYFCNIITSNFTKTRSIIKY